MSNGKLVNWINACESGNIEALAVLAGTLQQRLKSIRDDPNNTNNAAILESVIADAIWMTDILGRIKV